MGGKGVQTAEHCCRSTGGWYTICTATIYNATIYSEYSSSRPWGGGGGSSRLGAILFVLTCPPRMHVVAGRCRVAVRGKRLRANETKADAQLYYYYSTCRAVIVELDYYHSRRPSLFLVSSATDTALDSGEHCEVRQTDPHQCLWQQTQLRITVSAVPLS